MRLEPAYLPGMTEFPKGAALLSGYPDPKIIVECDKCGMRAKFDKLEMLEVGGDRMLTHLLTEIARRKGCTKLGGGSNIYDRCGAMYANILPDRNAYQKAREGR